MEIPLKKLKSKDIDFYRELREIYRDKCKPLIDKAKKMSEDARESDIDK